MKYYKYETKQDVEEAIDLINQYCGIPISEDSITKTYIEYFKYNDFYLIKVDDITKTVLGDNIFEIDINNYE